jgi:hypothetical protein
MVVRLKLSLVTAAANIHLKIVVTARTHLRIQDAVNNLLA